MARRPIVATHTVAVAVRGLRSRAVLTVGIALLALVGVASAVVGPMYLRAATNSLLVTRLEAAPTAEAGLTWRFDPSAETAADPRAAMRAAVDAADQHGPSAFGPAVPTWFSMAYDFPQYPVDVYEAVELAAVTDACERLVVLSGRCPRRPFEVLVAPIDVERGGYEVGSRIALDTHLPRPVVVGTYRLRDPGENWFDPSLYVSVPPGGGFKPRPYQPAPLMTVPETFERLPAGEWSVRVDRRLLVDPTLTPQRADALADAADRERSRDPDRVAGGVLEPADRNGLRTIVDEIDAERVTARNTVLPAALSLSLVAMLVLLRLLGEAADLRRSEFALLALRGWPRRRLWAFGLAEPTLVLLLAAPIGCLLGWSLSRWMGDAWLHPGVPVDLTTGSVIGAVAVTAAGLAAAAISLVHVMRERLHEQLVETARPRGVGRTEMVVQSATVATALVATYVVADRSERGDPGLVDLLVPVLLALAVGLLAGHLTILLARMLTRRTAGRRRLASYLSSRRLARRREGTLVVLPLAVALGVGVFAIGVHVAASDWRSSVAASRVGADVAYTAAMPPDRAMTLTEQLDPDGRWLMAAVAAPAPKDPPVVAVDTRRLGTVGLWPDTWGVASNAGAVADRLGSTREPPRVDGRSFALTVSNDIEIAGGLTVALELRAANSDVRQLMYTDVPTGETTVTADAPYCVDGCELIGVVLGGTGATPAAMTGSLALQTLAVDGEPVDAGFDETDSWRRKRPFSPSDGSVVAVEAGSSGLQLDVDTSSSYDTAEFTPTDVPDVRPIVVTGDTELSVQLGPDGDQLMLPGAGTPTGEVEAGLPVRVVGEAEAVPLVGRSGVLIDLQAYVREAFGIGVATTTYILATDGTPPDVVDALAAAGVDVDQPLSLAVEKERLGNDAYALSLRLYVVVAAALLLLALAGVVAHLVVGMPGRRRDAAALRVVGVSKWIALRAGLVELSVTLGVAAIAGLVAGVVAQRVVLGQIRLGSADSRSPDLPSSIDLPTVGAYGGATAVVLFAVAVTVAWASIRRARAAELRESAR
jgi:putative ABC transport system permease protein